jgi:DNA-binding transcriptional regulator YbjK
MPEAKARRADAEQNRSAIIEAAAQALAVDGEVSLNAIAKLAGGRQRDAVSALSDPRGIGP